MSFDSLLDETVTIYNGQPPGSGEEQTSRYGDPLEVDDAGVVVSARLEQTGTTENLDDRDTRVTHYRIFLPRTAPITALSVVARGGVRMRVDGDPNQVHGSAGVHHIEAELVELAG